MRSLGARDMDRCLGINRITLGREITKNLGRIAITQQRPGVAAADAVDQDVDARVKPDRCSLLQDQGARLVIDECASTRCNYLGFAIQQSCNHPALSVTKMILSITIKDFRNRQTRGSLNLVIGVDKGQLELNRKAPSNRRLADAHQPHKDQGTAGPGGRGTALQHCEGRYTATLRLGKRPPTARSYHVIHEKVSFMSRLAVSIIVILIVVVGALFLLAGQARERPQTRVEKAVTLANLQ